MADDDVVEGKMKQAEGKAQDALGDVTGNADDDVPARPNRSKAKFKKGSVRPKTPCETH